MAGLNPQVVGYRWNRLEEPIFVAASFFRLTTILHFEKFYAPCRGFFSLSLSMGVYLVLILLEVLEIITPTPPPKQKENKNCLRFL